MKWWLLLLTLSSSDHPIAYLSYATDALCEAVGEEFTARADAKGWTIDYRCIDTGKPPVWPMR